MIIIIMNKFFDRETEIAWLEEQYKEKAALSILYGRRRVGKSGIRPSGQTRFCQTWWLCAEIRLT